MRKLLPVALLFVSMSGVAAEFSVTKSMAPFSIYKPGYKGISVHQVMGVDYPRGAKTVSRLKSISWSTTLYPNATDETVELCYLALGTVETCRPISPNSSGETKEFNHLPYEYVTRVIIKHSIKSGPLNSKPAGQDSVRFNLSY